MSRSVESMESGSLLFAPEEMLDDKEDRATMLALIFPSGPSCPRMKLHHRIPRRLQGPGRIILHRYHPRQWVSV